MWALWWQCRCAYVQESGLRRASLVSEWDDSSPATHGTRDLSGVCDTYSERTNGYLLNLNPGYTYEVHADKVSCAVSATRKLDFGEAEAYRSGSITLSSTTGGRSYKGSPQYGRGVSTYAPAALTLTTRAESVMVTVLAPVTLSSSAGTIGFTSQLAYQPIPGGMYVPLIEGSGSRRIAGQWWADGFPDRRYGTYGCNQRRSALPGKHNGHFSLRSIITDKLMTETIQEVALPQEVQAFSILELFSQAGGFQWPILAVLIAGLVVLMLRIVRLFRDHLAARPLIRLNVELTNLSALNNVQQVARDSLYTRFLSGVLQLHRSPEAMGREVSDVAAAAHAAYARTQRVITYCSSTAGGLGLLGTLVGIYALFSTGTRDAQTIFAGIAIAVVSTLLGIVTSILLEFFEAVTHGYVSRYIESAQAWAQKVRSRVLCLSEEEA